MALVEVLALQLGPAIAKSVLKIWLKDSAIALDTSLSLVDVLKSKTQDFLTQRQSSRQFEAIGEKVALSLETVINVEYRSLGEDSKQSVIFSISTILDNTPITPEVLAKQDLDPAQFVDYLCEQNPKARDGFSRDEKEFFNLMLSQIAQGIIDIASQLPSFTEQTLAEVLKREKQIDEKVTQVLEEVRRIREGAERDNPELQAIHFEQDYCRAVGRKLDQLELFGLDVSSTSKRHPLTVAYVSLMVEQKREKSFEDHPIENDDEDLHTFSSVEDLLLNHQRILIRGWAGSGKTTLLQWIAVRSASQNFAGQLTTWNSTVPFFVRLRQCIDDGFPRPEEFPGLIAPFIQATMPNKWVHTQLNSGRAIVLVDGLDEVPETKRKDVQEWLTDIVNAYPNARYIVTTRPYAVQEGWLQTDNFQEAELQPMELKDIFAFVEHWHDAIKEGIQDDEEKARLEKLATRLKEKLKQTNSIKNLATSPLLCAMICALNRERQEQLPTDRIELYEAGCAMLLERRDIERKIVLQEYPQLSYRQKRVLLQDFAYWMLKNGWSEVSKSNAIERFGSRLGNMGGISDETTSVNLYRFFVERSGLMREPAVGKVDFVHRTFQEYLAAQAVIDEGDIGLLIKNAHDDHWREVVILAIGLASMKGRSELISQLIDRGDKETQHRHHVHLLAVACLETAIELDSDVRNEVEKRLQTLVPPKNMAEAKTLAAAGELAIPYLYKGDLRASEAAACVRALSLIGGDKAFQVIKNFSQETRKTVITQLLIAWDHFDRREYANQILSNLVWESPIKTPSVEGIEYLKKIKSLIVWPYFSSGAITNLEPLEKLTNLDELVLLSRTFWHDNQNLETPDLTPISFLTNLRKLELYGIYNNEDLNFLNTLTSLRILTLSNFRYLNNINSLGKLYNLVYLDVNGPNFSTIARQTYEIDLFGRFSFENVSPILVSTLETMAKLENLETLKLGACESITDIKFLEKLTNLKNLEIGLLSADIDFNPLLNLKKLEVLGIGANIDDLGPFLKLDSLRHLYLYYSKLKDINILEGLKNLEYAVIWQNDDYQIEIPNNLTHKVFVRYWMND